MDTNYQGGNSMALKSKKVRYAVVGLGHIAQVAVLPGFKNAKSNSELTALVSGDPVKLKKLSKQYKVKATYSYSNYDELLESGEIDAVYIATPNTDHLPYAIRAAEKGIHVLCEKPLAGDQESCQQMIRKVQQSGVSAMTAYRLHFDPANLKAIEVAQSKKLGDLKFFNSMFSYNIKDAKNIRLQLDKAGGPLHDIGIYCINASRYLFQDEPTEVFAYAAKDPNDRRFEEVEEMMTVLMKFPHNRLAQFVCSFGSAPTSRFDIVGSKGSVTLDSAYEYAVGQEMTIVIDEKKKKIKFKKHDQFGAELTYFSDCVLKNKKPEPSFTEGLADVLVIEAILESLQRQIPVAVQSLKKESRPTAAQKIRKPAVRKPEMVHVTSPSGD